MYTIKILMTCNKENERDTLGGIHLSCFQMATPWQPGKNANFMTGW